VSARFFFADCLSFNPGPISTRTHPIEDQMRSPFGLFLLLALLAWRPASADPIHKWVDSTGQVTYSSTPPPAGVPSEKVEVASPPTEDQIRQAQERAMRDKAQARELEKERLELEAARKAEAERRSAMQPTPPTVVIEKPVYEPQPIYSPPVIERPPGRRPVKPRPVPPTP
jgi:hypothetical protein